jgi:hypothetical protein
MVRCILVLIVAPLLFAGCDRQEEPSIGPPPVAWPQEAAAPPDTRPTLAPVAAPSTGPAPVVATSSNMPPRVVAVPFKNPVIKSGVDIEVAPEAEDPDYDLVSFRFQWFVNGEKQADLDGAVLPAERFRKGDHIALRVAPFDGKAEGAMFLGQSFTVPNAPPAFVTVPPLQFEAKVYTYEARAEDPDGDTLTYTLEAGPHGMAIDSQNGLLQWAIGQDQTGVHRVRVNAADEEGMKAVQEFTLTIAVGGEAQN